MQVATMSSPAVVASSYHWLEYLPDVSSSFSVAQYLIIFRCETAADQTHGALAWYGKTIEKHTDMLQVTAASSTAAADLPVHRTSAWKKREEGIVVVGRTRRPMMMMMSVSLIRRHSRHFFRPSSIQTPPKSVQHKTPYPNITVLEACVTLCIIPALESTEVQ